MTSDNTYHHGNLRQSLLNAALEIIAQDGYQAVSMRELAKRAGVSPGAPYRHFANRDRLLSAVASEGLKLLQQAQESAANSAENGRGREQAIGRAFLDFAQEHPGLFIVIYDSGLLSSAQDEDEFGQQLRALYDQLTDALARLQPETDAAQMKARLISMWSTLYGYARLRQSNMLKPYMLEGLTQQQVEDAVIAAAFGHY